MALQLIDGSHREAAMTASAPMSRPMTVSNLDQHLVEMKYAVRGAVVAKSAELQKKLDAGEKLPFERLILCNIGNPHAVQQKPITFYRQVAACCACPALCEGPEDALAGLAKGTRLQAMADDGVYYAADVVAVSRKKGAKAPVKVNYVGYDRQYDEWKPLNELRSKKIPKGAGRGKSSGPGMSDVMPEDVKRRAREYLAATGGNGIGAYTGSTGLKLVRDQIAAFIERRDGFPADPEAIELHTGASEGVKRVIQALIAKEEDVVMIPKPQYPLYSAALTMFGGKAQYYECAEELDWTVTEEELERSYKEGCEGNHDVKAIAVINPGNPTGNVLSLENVKMFIKFGRDKNVPILADEVYQVNVYDDTKEFHSFKKVLRMMQKEDKSYDKVQLMSFHSTSKGIIGECGLRGGYTEFVGMSNEVMALFVKVASTSLSSNTLGQIMCGLMVTPPKKGEASDALFQRETKAIFSGMKQRAAMLSEGLNAIPGISTRQIQGAMYAFAKVEVPEKAAAQASSRGMAGDEFWCLELVEKTGIVCVPGSGFGQKEGTFHFRITILPPAPMLTDMLKRLGEFQESFLKEWA